ncbi:glycosyltransferase family 4 protein [Maribacter polysiphoniae]|uniref:Glycosyltransferase family 4 protein n=1 Tax=Maribacter polysiphoniae TaxID=429344 RepID=A0A316DYZ3_9FLAO|nr:glycosyltransferase family 4 protein [Maribacter polysiphoniae]MBD1261733.1 glycosyltransferase family 4 protein [Maribacter polysiphoniae]PWK22459.1 glycosyltransferase involved in cell wall biosynthesis [Maribacter polysiphoniae]
MKKVLIVTYYWPPAGGPGVQRWLKFVKYLPEFGITPIVYIPENPNYPIIDDSIGNEVPEGLVIYRHPIREPYKVAGFFSKNDAKRISSGIITTKNQSFLEKVMLWVRGNFFIPDARKNWVKPSVRFLQTIIEKENIDCLVTTGPPHSLHLIGNQLKQITKVKWLADFRDPWTSIGYHKKLKLTRKSQQEHKRLEQLVLNNADRVIVTSNTTKEEFQGITQKPISVITNGYDTDISVPKVTTKGFTISHIGSLLSGRNPAILWQVLGTMVLENDEFDSCFKLRLAGVVSEDVLQSIYDAGLRGHTELLGYVSHEEAVRLQQESQVLLLVEIDSHETKGILPGKLYEYMAAGRPILGIGPKGWDAARIIADTHSGFSFGYDDENKLKDVLLKWFEAYSNDGLIMDAQGIEKYSRRALTRELAKLI